MSASSGAARRALRRINANPQDAQAFQDRLQSVGAVSQSAINREAIAFSQQLFQAQADVYQVEREASRRRAQRRREAAQNVVLPDYDDVDNQRPQQDMPLEEFRQWIIDHANEVMFQNQTYIIQSGDAYYTLHRENYYDILDMIDDFEHGLEFIGQAGSGEVIIIEILNTGEFTATLFVPEDTSQRVVFPDRNRGSFLPYVHNIQDDYVENELAKYGLWKEVKAENYECSCLVQSLIPSLDETVIQDIKEAVRNASVPRKHLRLIGLKYNLQFVVHTDGDKNVPSFGDPKGKKIELCLFKGHYFPFVKNTGITGFALKNWQALKTRYPSNWYIKGGIGGQRGTGVSSMRLIKIMVEPQHGLVEPIDISNPEIWKTVYLNRVNKSFNKLEYTEDSVKLVHPVRGTNEDKRDFNREISGIKRLKQKILSCDGGEETVARIEKQVNSRGLGYTEQHALYRSNVLPQATIFFDFESCSQGVHEAYFVAWQVDGEEQMFNASGVDCAVEFLNWIEYFYGANDSNEDEDQAEITLIAHNVSYDISFILEHLKEGSMKAIKKGSKFISASGIYASVQLQFKDSYKIIPSALREFGKMFNLPHEKEVMPYDIFTHDFIKGDFLIHPDIIDQICGIGIVEQMRPNIEKLDCISETDGVRWDMLKYSKFYCERDVELLNGGWNAFRKMTLEFFDLDINAKELLTTASMAFKHLQNECFDGTYSVSGMVLEFIRQATFGGQTQSARNEAMIIEGKPILDMDKVSLYPTAMVNMPGIPLGKPKPFYDEIPIDANYFFVQIHVHTVNGPEYDFPLIPIRTKQGVNDWSNDIEGCTLIVGKQTLEDLIAWNDEFDYTVLRGYYWNEGWNTKLSKTIQDMYNRRAELKGQGNPAQLIFKLLMNSSYGRTGLKPIADMDYYIPPDKLNRFIANNYYRISHMTIMPNGDTRVVANKAINRHFNQQHVAAMILETSKHLMRKVLLLQQRIGSPLAGQIFYTDTDSIHISEPAWGELEAIYKNKYDETLEGKNLGQFHSDFEMDGTFMIRNGTLVPTDLDKSVLQGGSLYSRKLIICGKKAYLDILTSTKNTALELYHFRLKGIPEKSIVAKCNANYEGQIERLYEELVTGIKMTFTLSGLFKTGRDGLIKTTSMDRTVKFQQARKIQL